MTEMVYGSMPGQARDAVLPRWWRTIDKWTLTAILVLFGIGMLLGTAPFIIGDMREYAWFSPER